MRMVRGRALLIRQAQQAAALGHRVDIESRDRRDEFPEQGHAAVKWWVVCSCGYRSTARATQAQALGTVFWHVGQVVGDGGRRNGSAPAPTGDGEPGPEQTVADTPDMAKIPRAVGESL